MSDDEESYNPFSGFGQLSSVLPFGAKPVMEDGKQVYYKKKIRKVVIGPDGKPKKNKRGIIETEVVEVDDISRPKYKEGSFQGWDSSKPAIVSKSRGYKKMAESAIAFLEKAPSCAQICEFIDSWIYSGLDFIQGFVDSEIIKKVNGTLDDVGQAIVDLLNGLISLSSPSADPGAIVQFLTKLIGYIKSGVTIVAKICCLVCDLIIYVLDEATSPITFLITLIVGYNKTIKDQKKDLVCGMLPEVPTEPFSTIKDLIDLIRDTVNSFRGLFASIASPSAKEPFDFKALIEKVLNFKESLKKNIERKLQIKINDCKDLMNLEDSLLNTKYGSMEKENTTSKRLKEYRKMKKDKKVFKSIPQGVYAGKTVA